MANNNVLSKDLKSIAETIDEMIKKSIGERRGFCLTVFTANEDEDVQYISNCERTKVAKSFITMLKNWADGMPDIKTHERH